MLHRLVFPTFDDDSACEKMLSGLGSGGGKRPLYRSRYRCCIAQENVLT